MRLNLEHTFSALLQAISPTMISHKVPVGSLFIVLWLSSRASFYGNILFSIFLINISMQPRPTTSWPVCLYNFTILTLDKMLVLLNEYVVYSIFFTDGQYNGDAVWSSFQDEYDFDIVFHNNRSGIKFSCDIRAGLNQCLPTGTTH